MHKQPFIDIIALESIKIITISFDWLSLEYYLVKIAFGFNSILLILTKALDIAIFSNEVLKQLSMVLQYWQHKKNQKKKKKETVLPKKCFLCMGRKLCRFL